MSIQHRADEIITIDVELVAYPGYDANHLLKEKWDTLFPGDAIVKCEYCGQWGARRCECKYCGHSID